MATAPVTWGVWEATIERADLVPPARLLEAMRGCGYAGVELGPPAYFGSTPELTAQRLRDAGMTLVGAFVPLQLAHDGGPPVDETELALTLATLTHFKSDRPLVILADAGSPERVMASGNAQQLHATSLRGQALTRAADRLSRVAQECGERGLSACFHHHAESYFEAPEEVDALLDRVDQALLGLCLDTGHALIGGGDPLELMRRWAPRIAHLHLKDVDPTLLGDLRSGTVGMERAWERGLFCPMGGGAVDFDGLFALPELRGFEAVAVLEQDRIAVTTRDLADVAHVEEANLARISAAAERSGIALTHA